MQRRPRWSPSSSGGSLYPFGRYATERQPALEEVHAAGAAGAQSRAIAGRREAASCPEPWHDMPRRGTKGAAQASRGAPFLGCRQDRSDGATRDVSAARGASPVRAEGQDVLAADDDCISAGEVRARGARGLGSRQNSLPVDRSSCAYCVGASGARSATKALTPRVLACHAW